MCNFLSSFSASAGPIISSYTPDIANKTVATKEMIFTNSKIVLIKAVILNHNPHAIVPNLTIKLLFAAEEQT